MYWRIKNDRSRYRSLINDGAPYDSQDLLGLNGKTAIDERKLLYKIDWESSEPIPDFMATSLVGTLTASEELITNLALHLNLGSFKLYSINADVDHLKLFVTQEEVPGFDFENSVFKRSDGDIIRIQTLKIKEGVKTDLDLFRLKDDWGPRFELICSSRFTALYDELKLTGLSFAPAL